MTFFVPFGFGGYLLTIDDIFIKSNLNYISGVMVCNTSAP